jgi:hypothetical protein
MLELVQQSEEGVLLVHLLDAHHHLNEVLEGPGGSGYVFAQLRGGVI